MGKTDNNTSELDKFGGNYNVNDNIEFEDEYENYLEGLVKKIIITRYEADSIHYTSVVFEIEELETQKIYHKTYSNLKDT